MHTASAPARPDTLASARATLEYWAPSVLARADELVSAGTHVWTPDPDFPRVWGLVDLRSRRAPVVVYLDGLGDFECDDDL